MAGKQACRNEPQEKLTHRMFAPWGLRIETTVAAVGKHSEPI